MSKTYIVSEAELKVLIEYFLELLALKDEGVDNWEWYGDAIHESEYWNSDESSWDIDKYIKDANIKELH